MKGQLKKLKQLEQYVGESMMDSITFRCRATICAYSQCYYGGCNTGSKASAASMLKFDMTRV